MQAIAVCEPSKIAHSCRRACLSSSTRRNLPLMWAGAAVLCLATILSRAQTVSTTVNVGNAPAAAAINPVSNKIYVANTSDNNVTVIDGATNTTVTVNTGSGPAAVSLQPVSKQNSRPYPPRHTATLPN